MKPKTARGGVHYDQTVQGKSQQNLKIYIKIIFSDKTAIKI